ncbi:MAG: nucleotidyltransferase [Bacilli bacterium]|nr:nucleotidyltransferase [Bacilli bacterium]
MKKTLVVMAAGMGSRFGGLKQIEPVGPSGEYIIDYSIYDAIRCGFNKIVFIIKEENLDIFRQTIGKRIEGSTDVEIAYAFQKISDIPINIDFGDREKPLGTGHAIYCARNDIEGNFAVINADDFYGYTSFEKLSRFLEEEANDNTYALVGYKLKNTVTDNGSVKRGVCFGTDKLERIDESLIEKVDNRYIRTSLESKKKEEVSGDVFVSMNLLAFSKGFLKYISTSLEEFLSNPETDLTTGEFGIPTVIEDVLENNLATVKIIETDEKWYGITYKEDKQMVVDAINKMIESGIYKKNLWEK